MRTLWNKTLKNPTIDMNDTVGSGMSEAEFVGSVTVRSGNLAKTDIVIDLTGLENGGAAGDIIGSNDAANCWFFRVDPAKHGTIYAGKMTCHEAPAGIDADIDVYSATEGTGTENAAISALTETALVDAGDATAGAEDVFTAWPAAGEYLYLVAGAGATTFSSATAGRLLIELWGKVT